MLKTTYKSDRKVRGILSFIALMSFVVLVLYVFTYHLWWVFLIIGIVLFGVSYLIPAPAKQQERKGAKATPIPEGQVVEGSTEMTPDNKGTTEIETVPEMIYDRSPGVFLAKHLFFRFVLGQQSRTANTYLDFLKQANEATRLNIEHRRLKHQMGRVDMEENAETERTRRKASRVQKEADFEDHRIDADDEEVLLRKDQAAKKRTDMGNSSPNPKFDEGRVKQDNLRKIEQKIEKLKERMRITTADPTLDEDVRMRILNRLNHELEKAEEEYVQML